MIKLCGRMPVSGALERISQVLPDPLETDAMPFSAQSCGGGEPLLKFTIWREATPAPCQREASTRHDSRRPFRFGNARCPRFPIDAQME
jgi:hypothetical protein